MIDSEIFLFGYCELVILDVFLDVFGERRRVESRVACFSFGLNPNVEENCEFVSYCKCMILLTLFLYSFTCCSKKTKNRYLLAGTTQP